MPEHTRIAATYVHALADPLRVAIVGALDGGPLTAASLARRLEVAESAVGRHARTLENMGLVRRSGARPPEFELVREPVAWLGTWEDIPVPARRTAAAASLTQLHASATAAIDAGGFDRADMLLTRTSLPVTEARWTAVSRLLHDTLNRLEGSASEAETEATADPQERATAVLMLFRSGRVDAHANEEPPPEFGDEEARERTCDVAEELLELVPSTESVPWERVAALAEQLRLIALAIARADDARQPAPADRP